MFIIISGMRSWSTNLDVLAELWILTTHDALPILGSIIGHALPLVAAAAAGTLAPWARTVEQLPLDEYFSSTLIQPGILTKCIPLTFILPMCFSIKQREQMEELTNCRVGSRKY